MGRTRGIEVLSPVAGLDYSEPGTAIDLKASTNMQNVRLHKGVVRPAPGYSNYGSLNTVLGIPQLITEYAENDGDLHTLCFTTKYIYEYNTTLANWGNVVSRQKVLSEADVAWTASANVTASQETTIKVNGTASAKFVIAAAFTTGLAAYEDFAAVDTTTCSHIHFWIRSSIVTTSGQLQILVDNTSACASALQAYDVPALAANTWTQVEVAIGSGSNAAVISVGLNVATDVGAAGATVYIDRVIMADRLTGAESDRWSVDKYLDRFYATNGVDYPTVKDHGTAFDDWAEAVTATYKCKTLASFRNHLCMGNMIEGGTDYPQRFRWTDSGAVTFGGTAGSTETEGSDSILRLKPLGNKLACYKVDGHVLVTHIGGSTVYRFDKPVTGGGILSMDLVCDFGEFHMYTTSDNMYIYGGGSDPVPFGDKIRDEFFRTMNDTYKDRAFMHYSVENEELYIFSPHDGATTANTIWVYHTDTNVWSKRTKDDMSAIGAAVAGATAVTFGDAVGTFGSQTLTFGDRGLTGGAPILLMATSDGVIQKIDESLVSDLGAAVDKIWDSCDFTADRMPRVQDEPVRYTDNLKRWMRISFEARGTATSLYYSTDEGETWTLGKTYTLTALNKKYFWSIDIPSEKLRVRFRNNGATDSYYLRWLGVEAIGRGEF